MNALQKLLVACSPSGENFVSHYSGYQIYFDNSRHSSERFYAKRNGEIKFSGENEVAVWHLIGAKLKSGI